MSPETVVDLTRNAMFLLLLLAAPIVVAAAVIGLAVGFLQAITSIQDQTIAVALKLIVIGVLLAVLATWFGQEINTYALRVFGQIATI